MKKINNTGSKISASIKAKYGCYIAMTTVLLTVAYLSVACHSNVEVPKANISYGPEIGIADGNVDLTGSDPIVNISAIKADIGMNIDYLSGVTIANEGDFPDLEIWVDASLVDIFTPGNYTAVYTFVYGDNSVSHEITVTIVDTEQSASDMLPTDSSSNNDVSNNSSKPTSNNTGQDNTTKPTSGNSGQDNTTKPTSGNSGQDNTTKPTSGNSGQDNTTKPTSGNSGQDNTTKPTSGNSGQNNTTKPTSGNSGQNNTTKPTSGNEGQSNTTAPTTTKKPPATTTAPTTTKKPTGNNSSTTTTREIITTTGNKTTENKHIGNYTIELLSGKTITIRNTTSKYIVSTRTDVTYVEKKGYTYKVSKLIITYNTGAQQVLETVEERQ